MNGFLHIVTQLKKMQYTLVKKYTFQYIDMSPLSGGYCAEAGTAPSLSI